MEMNITVTLTKDDLDKILAALGDTPMRYAMPIFQIITARVQEQKRPPTTGKAP